MKIIYLSSDAFVGLADDSDWVNVLEMKYKYQVALLLEYY